MLYKCSYLVEIGKLKWIVRKIINAWISVPMKRKDTEVYENFFEHFERDN